MSSATLTFLALLCPLIGTALGIALRRRLPQHHLSPNAIDVIKLAAGLMATLVALVLGLLITSANTYRVSVENGYRQMLASVVQLDQYLRAYGPETRDIRARVRGLVVGVVQERWPDEAFGPAEVVVEANHEAMIELQRKIALLAPGDAAQRWFQSQALQITNNIVLLRQLMWNQEAEGASRLPVFMVVFLSTVVVFGSFSLFVKPNPTVVGSLALAALTIAGATFVIAELNSPFHGLLQVPSTAAHAAVTTLGK
jgi:hypothetical protein